MADADTAARRAFAGRVTEGVKARLLDIGDELHRAVVRLVVWHPKNLGDALCQRQVAQRQLFAHEHRDGEIAGGLSLHDFRSEEPTSELQSLMRNSYAVFSVKKKT